MSRPQDPGPGGFCLLPRPVRLGPVFVYDRANARAGIRRNMLFWAGVHRDRASRCRFASDRREARELMRVCALIWRAHA